MEQARETQDSQQRVQEKFGLFEGQGPLGRPFCGIASKAEPTEIEVMRTKLLKKFDNINNVKATTDLAFMVKQRDMIAILQTVLETYGWNFG